MRLKCTVKISNISLIFILYVSVSFLYFYIDQYFHTHVASNYSYTRPYFRAFYLFDTWSYAILFSSFLFILAVIEKDRIRAFFALGILVLTSMFNVLFLGVNFGYYFPWNLITTEPSHWLMRWGINLIESLQWMLFLIGMIKNRKFTLLTIPSGLFLILATSLFRNELRQILNVGPTPIETAFGVTLVILSAFTIAYPNLKKKGLRQAIMQTIVISLLMTIAGLVAWFAPKIHETIPIFIFERDLCLVSVLFAVIASFFASKVLKKAYFEINKKYLIVTAMMMVFLLPVLGYVQYQGRDNVVVDYIGGKYEARIRLLHFTESEEFYYVKGEEGFSGYYDAKFRASLNWMKNDIPDSSVILCWWDYGHMIRGIAEMEVVIYAPSKEILWSIVDPSQIHEYSDHQRVLDVAEALTTTNPNETISLMSKYSATYIFVSIDDAAKAGILLKIAGKSPEMYITPDGFTEQGKQMTLYKILEKMSIDGFEKAYDDADVIVYKLG